jgi:flagella basal body P-ring formation protein FlgA
MHASRAKWNLIIQFALFLLIAVISLSPCYALEIRIKEGAMVRGDTVCLGDISTFEPADDHRIGELQGIEVSSAPPPGSTYRLNKRFLSYKIGSAIGEAKDINLHVPGSLVIQRTAQLMSAERMENIFREHIISHSPWPADKLSFDRINTPGSIAFPEGEMHWEVVDKGQHEYLGNVALVIDVWVDGKQLRKLPLSGKVSVMQKVVRAARRIRRGQMIVREDVVSVEENNDSLLRDVLMDPDEASGKRAVRTIQPGQLLTSQMVESPPLVKKGDRVVIKAENQFISATTAGRVLEEGRSGDHVRVINIRSGKEIVATVRGPSMVEVSF